MAESFGDTTSEALSWTDGNEATIENTPTAGAALLAGSSEPTYAFALTGNQAVVTDAQVLTGFPFTVTALFSATASKTNHRLILDAENGAGHYVEMAIYGAAGPPAGAGRLRVAMYDGTATKTLFSSAVVDDGSTHHVAWTAADAADWRLYVDGVDVGVHLSGHGASSTVTFPTLDSGWSIGNTPGATYGDQGFGGDIGHVATWNDQALSAARIAAHADSALTAWSGDTTAQRLAHLLDAIGWPTSERNIGTGTSIVGIAGYSGAALDYALELGQTENGLCYQDGLGRVTFIGRQSLLTVARHTTSNATFGDSGSELAYQSVTPTFNNTNIRNRVVINRAGAATVIAKDDTSIANYGMRSYSRSSLSAEPTDARDTASWILQRYKDPVLRFDKLSIQPRKDPSNLWPQALGRDIGDLVTIRRRPQSVGDMIEKEVQIEGISHTITPDGWVTSWDLTPGETIYYWILGTSELDTGTRLTF